MKFAVAALLAGGISLSQTPARAAAELSKDDREFLETASQINIGEIEGGKAAQKKASSAEVKMMGEQLVKDHEKAQSELKKLASSKGVQVPEEPTPADKKAMAELEKVGPEQFDKQFTDHQLKGHKKAISLHEKAAKESKDADIKAFAEKQLPVLRSHRAMAEKGQSAGSNMNGDKKKAGEPNH